MLATVQKGSESEILYYIKSKSLQQSEKRKDRKGFAGKRTQMMEVKGPAGGRGAGRSLKKGHK